ncbi:MATE family Na+-driven multidrug efflux pump [Candidatus Phytoplasma solani]|uniref:MATE family efflux transporter n=1 Tax=Candidatus Phytoplasma solani TaxID=69896 RepID=UPI0032DABD79
MNINNHITKKHNSSHPQRTFERPIWKNLIILTIPIAIYLLFQHLGTSIDFYIIGTPKKLLNVDSTITYMKQIKKILQSIAISLGGAGVVLVAREYKRQNKEKSKQYATLAFVLSVAISLVLLIILGLGPLLPSYLGDIFLKSDYHPDGGFLYYQLSLITFVFITINSVFIGLERAKNKTKFVLMLNILLIIVRIMISFIYKFVKKEGNVTVIHLALADLFSNLLISFIAFYCMFSSKNPFQFQFKKLVFSRNIVQSMLKLSGTLIIGKVTYEIGKKIILDMSTNYYNDLVAISGLVAVVNGICYAVSQSFEDSQSAMVAQSVACENDQKTFKIFKNVFVITLIIGIIGFLSNYFLGEYLLQLLKPGKKFSPTEKVNFNIILFWEGTSLFTSVWASMMMGYILSYKKNANLIFWMNLLRVVLRIALLFTLHEIFQNIPNAQQFGLSTFGSNITVLIVTAIIFIAFLRKNKMNSLKSTKSF